MTPFVRYRPLHFDFGSLAVCQRCASLLADNEVAKQLHDNFHDRVEHALDLASGYPS